MWHPGPYSFVPRGKFLANNNYIWVQMTKHMNQWIILSLNILRKFSKNDSKIAEGWI